MELDELKLAWQSLDRRLDRQETLQLRAYRDGQVDRLLADLRPLKRGQLIQLFTGIALTLLFAPFWVVHLHTPHLFVIGVLLHAYALMFIVMAARTLVEVNRVDPSAPVLAIQRQIAALHTWRLRESWWFGAVGCLMWVPLTLYVFTLLGADVYLASPGATLSFVVSGLVCLAIFLVLTLRVRRRSTRWARWMDDSAAGASVRRARARVDELARFDSERA